MDSAWLFIDGAWLRPVVTDPFRLASSLFMLSAKFDGGKDNVDGLVEAMLRTEPRRFDSSSLNFCEKPADDMRDRAGLDRAVGVLVAVVVVPRRSDSSSRNCWAKLTYRR